MDVVAWLLEQGASADIRDSEGDTPLMACEDAQCADLLLGKGATLEAMNDAGDTAYHTASQEFREEMIAWLEAQYASRGLTLPIVPVAEEVEDEDEELGSLPDEGADAEAPVAP